MVIVYFTSLIRQSICQRQQINLLNTGCSNYNASNLPNFYSNRDGAFSNLRRQLLNDSRHFATAEQARRSSPVYTMVQCRNYLSTRDCVACFDVAVVQIRNCSGANGARVIYDGCFLRYESLIFYNQTTVQGNFGICGNRTVSPPTAFNEAVQGLLTDLVIATPRINGYFAATSRQVVGGGRRVYAVAQCVETTGQTNCLDCLTQANVNIGTCPPEADGRAIDAGCFMRYSDTSFFPDNQTINIRPFITTGGSSNRRAIIGGAVGGGGLILLIVALLLWYKLSRKPSANRRGSILGATELQGPNNYKYKDLKSATKNFSEEYKLGEGGFGDVFKGILKNGDIVAVKRLAMDSRRAKEEFESEVTLISNVHHRNLIRLLGCSRKSPDLLLVLEYMANGSLDKFLYGEKRGTLNWKQRLNIIFGTARGLAYLHEQFHVTIIHRDIKSSNILLDDDFQPKIADFGLARLLPEDKTHVNTKFAGTLGYTAPEYAIQGQLSEKVDTYSFGIVMLEIISGRRCNEMQSESVADYLLENAWKLYENDMHLSLVDKTLDPSEYREEDAKRIIEIALMCTQSPVTLRPIMSEVVIALSSDRGLETRPPNRPTLIDPNHRILVDSSASTGSVTFTEFTGR